MNRLVLIVALFTATTGLALSASANNNNAERANYTSQPNSQRTHGYEYAKNDGRECIKSGWIDNEELQKWRIKNPGISLCFSEQVGSSEPVPLHNSTYHN